MHRRRLSALLVLLSLAGFLTTLDNTVINVALPTVQSELGLSVADLEWVTTSYVLSFGTLLLAGGRVADLAGRRPVLAVTGLRLAAGCVLLGAVVTAVTLGRPGRHRRR
ncbi:MFS transporter [Streptomyces sp. NPDC058145]|uniref:MFS transporter n=1 Tax=Streptomyces sp. NPDC058145 TaxID=3346356 RepID=UPI0036E12D14